MPRHAPYLTSVRALSIAPRWFLAQVFLRSGAIVLLAAIALLIFRRPAGLLMAPAASFYVCAGLVAVRRAGQAVSGGTPLPARAAWARGATPLRAGPGAYMRW